MLFAVRVHMLTYLVPMQRISVTLEYKILLSILSSLPQYDLNFYKYPSEVVKHKNLKPI